MDFSKQTKMKVKQTVPSMCLHVTGVGSESVKGLHQVSGESSSNLFSAAQCGCVGVLLANAIITTTFLPPAASFT